MKTVENISKRKKLMEALKAFKAAYEADPADVEIVNNLGYIALLSGDFAAAEQHLLSALVLAPSRSLAWINLGQTYAKQGKHRQAIAGFANAYRFSHNREREYKRLQNLQETDEDIRVQKAVAETLQLELITLDKGGSARVVSKVN
jgi:predicted Zn-dependent protease